MDNYMFHGKLIDVDEAIANIIDLEAERQKRKLIMIASESFAPDAIRESLGSVFQNVYAEGYPDEATRKFSEERILDLDYILGNYRRNSDPRYYKGVEYVDVLEPLARRRCAELFAHDDISADDIYVNVQPLSGAPANNAVYHLINPGDTVLAMDLIHGGHLSHGSPANRTGQLYNIVHYTVDPDTEMINYDELQRLASEVKPKIIICGYTSYPYIPDWKRYREIADSVGAYLLADIAHIAGLVAAGVVPSPVGIVDVVSFTTHKTLTGPRGACLLTTDAKLAKLLDKAVFPGEQGGPHTQVFAALATIFKIAKTPEYKEYQSQILKNTQALVAEFKARGLKVPYQGSNSHMLLLDCKAVKGEDGTTLSGDLAARVLDICGIVLNRNTIPGDKSAMKASGIRMGTACVTQIGMKEEDMKELADIIADVLYAFKPYTMPGVKTMLQRARVDFAVVEDAKVRVRKLIEKHTALNKDPKYGYPNFYYLDDEIKSGALRIGGGNYREFVNYAFLSDAESISDGEQQETVLIANGIEIPGTLLALEDAYQFACDAKDAPVAAAWLRALSDGYAAFDSDLRKRLPGPISVTECVKQAGKPSAAKQFTKVYAIGMKADEGTPLPEFDFSAYDEDENAPIKRTPLYEIHKALGAKMVPFAGWDMPVRYASIKEEHNACRKAGGLFDVSHMGVYEANGKDAVVFLNSVCANDISVLKVGDTIYTHLLDQDANVIDDLIIYRLEAEKYLIVVNASNDDKDWAWMNAVREGTVLVDRSRPSARAFGRNVKLENLRDPKAGERMRVDLALQGRVSIEVLLKLGCNEEDAAKIKNLKKGCVTHAVVGGYDLYLARTGYTGEKISFELFVHPEKLPSLWNALLAAGEPLGLKPCGLGARDSLRTEAGLPLYGHEMAGDMGIKVNEAGFASSVKTFKCWFIGRDAYRKDEAAQKLISVRWSFNDTVVRMAHHGDPVLDAKGKAIGRVTSCATDTEGRVMGLALIDRTCNAEGTPIFIYQNAEKAKLKAPSELKFGEKTVQPAAATVLSRFPKLS